jgi:hypothetical protein
MLTGIPVYLGEFFENGSTLQQKLYWRLGTQILVAVGCNAAAKPVN